MKILQINKFYPPHLGGVETIVKDITDGLNSRAGFEVDVLACESSADDKKNSAHIYRAKTRFKILGMPLSFDFFRLFFKLEKNYDALFFHHPFPLAFLTTPFLKNKKIFVWYHSDIIRQKIGRLIFYPFIRLGLKKATKIFVSGAALPANSRLLKKYAAKCVVIPFGLPDRFFSLTIDSQICNAAQDEKNKTLIQTEKDNSAPEEDSSAPGIEEKNIAAQIQEIRHRYGAPLILSVGRLVYYKGFKYLIRALAGSNYQLLIIGEGSERKRLDKEIKKSGSEKQITIIPPVADLIPYYLSSDLFVLPSCAASEAYGIVQAEAMACGRPIINTSLPTPAREVNEDGRTGLTIAPKNPVALRRAIDTIINDADLRRRYGTAAKEKAGREFTRTGFLDKLEKYLN